MIAVKDGYLVVNGIMTEYKVADDTTPEVKEDVITVKNGCLVVNGVKTEYKVHSKPVISAIDGYVTVNGDFRRNRNKQLGAAVKLCREQKKKGSLCKAAMPSSEPFFVIYLFLKNWYR